MTQKSNQKSLAIPHYPALRRQIHQTLLVGQKEIEKAKVQTYWRTGKIIGDHIRRYGGRSEHYGTQVVERLAADLAIDKSNLFRCIRFAALFKIVDGRPQSFPDNLSWSHYRKLITVSDDETRDSLFKRAQRSDWTADQLTEKIELEARKGSQEPHPSLSLKGRGSHKLKPKRGTLYTYRLISFDSAHGEEDSDKRWIDLGFQARRRLPESAKGFKAGALIESLRDKHKHYSVRRTQRTEADLFTFKAFVERVVDGDTMIVKIDLGFDVGVREYLRLRGINTPEMDTPAGKKSKAFVEKALAKTDHIILSSSRSEKYGRFVADIFYGPADEIFLNQQLLDEGLALPYE